MRVPVLLLTGPVGAGKTSVLGEVTDLLRATGTRFAAVELDAISYCFPTAPDDDRWRSALTFRNLAALWRIFRAAGAERLVLSRVIESRDELARCRRAIPGAKITVVRLRASVPTLRQRLAGREIGRSRAWHLRRAGQLSRIMDRARVEDVLVETDGRTVGAVAREVLDRVEWLPKRHRRPPGATSRRSAPSRRSGG